MYEQVTQSLRTAYDRQVEERDTKALPHWKVAERTRFLALLQSEHKAQLLDIGAGTGVHGQFFHAQGLIVTCTDLSPRMVEACQAKGLTAFVMDFLHLDFLPQTFEAIFALNCLLHVPRQDLPTVLRGVRDLLQPDGLFYWGQYGGRDREGTWAEDQYEPKRFFSLLSDGSLRRVGSEFFTLVDFTAIPLGEAGGGGQHFQGTIWRRS